MTTRRRRKLGSGPSATALIAWVGGTRTVSGASAGAAVSGVHAWSSSRLPGGRAILVGRAFGLAAGTVLACGSVLASAVQVGDGSLTGKGEFLPSHPPDAPGAGSSASDGYGVSASTERMSAAPVPVSAQALARKVPAQQLRPARVHRNNPVSVGVPTDPSPPSQAGQPPWRSSAPSADQAPTNPIAPVNPVLDPAASEVGRVAPVGGVLEPATARDKPTRKAPASSRAVARTRAVAPLVEKATQPALTMLDGLLPIF